MLTSAPIWKDLDAPIVSCPVTVTLPGGSRKRLKSTQAIVLKGRGKVLTVTSSRYRPVPHLVIFRSMHEAIREVLEDFPGLGVEGIRTDVGRHGAYAEVEWILTHDLRVRPGERTRASILVKNSLDATIRSSAELTGYHHPGTAPLRAPRDLMRLGWRTVQAWERQDLRAGVFQLLGFLPLLEGVWSEWERRQASVESIHRALLARSQTRQTIGAGGAEAFLRRLRSRSTDGRGISLWQAYVAVAEYAANDLQVRGSGNLPVRREQTHRGALRMIKDLTEGKT